MSNSLTEKCLKFMMKSVIETGKIMCDKDHKQSTHREVFLETGYLNQVQNIRVCEWGEVWLGLCR